jgi:ketosteroid isomerase-like protein
MSQENVETARRANAAMNRGDFQGVAEVFAHDAVLEDLQNAPDQPIKVEGVEAIRTTLSLWAAAFDELHAGRPDWPEARFGSGLSAFRVRGVHSAARQCVYLTSCSMSEPPETSTASTAWPLPLA